MKNIARLLCLLLAVVLVAVMGACQPNTPAESEPQSTAESVEDSQPEQSAEESHELFYNLPQDKNYNGEPFTFLVQGNDAAAAYASVEIMPQETSYEALQIAVSSRNDLVSEKFGVEIVEIRANNQADMMDKVRSSAMSGISEYDVVMPYMQDAAQLAMEGLFFDLNTLENVHLDESYYVQNSVKGFSIQHKNYFVSGNLCLLDFACTHALVFNKDMIKENNLDSPYDLVENHEWTLDKMMEMAHGVAHEDDGVDGWGIGDVYGFLVNGNFATSMFIGCGFRLTDKNERDEPIVAIGSESSAAAFDKIYNLINDDTSVGKIDGGTYMASASAAGKSCWVAATESVANKKALFRALAIIDVFDLGDYDCNFGILPTPMLDKNQDEYLCRVSTILSSCAAIPINVADSEKSAIILDAMMQSSTSTTKKAYFQTILKERKIQDTESEHMLDIIFDGRVYDLAYLYSWGGGGVLLSGFMNDIAFSSPSNTFVSSWESIKTATETTIQETIDTYSSLS